ncbi:MAG: GTP-binding protein, partial [Lewinella sp.]|nr:GTP-binding protein [Lewinella sp.]
MGYDTKNIRNVVLLGHPDAGKTTLAECMLFEAGEISRRGSINEGTTVSDYTNIEKERGNTLFSSLMHAPWKDSKINVIDTPGFDDYIGEVISAMKVADTGVMVLNACNGVEVGTEIIWEYIESFKTPALFVINQMDHDKANYETTLEQAQARFGAHVLPVQYPYNPGSGFNSIIDGLTMVMYVFPNDGGKPEKQPIPESEMARAKEIHNSLVEAAAENDDGLMEKYFEAGTLSEE